MATTATHTLGRLAVRQRRLSVQLPVSGCRGPAWVNLSGQFSARASKGSHSTVSKPPRPGGGKKAGSGEGPHGEAATGPPSRPRTRLTEGINRLTAFMPCPGAGTRDPTMSMGSPQPSPFTNGSGGSSVPAHFRGPEMWGAGPLTVMQADMQALAPISPQSHQWPWPIRGALFL